MNIRKDTIGIMLVIIIVIFLAFNFSDKVEKQIQVEDEFPAFYETGLVVDQQLFHQEGDFSYDYQNVLIKILSGQYKGEYVSVENHLAENDIYSIEVENDDKVVLMIQEYDGERDIYISDFSREGIIKVLVFAFLAILILIGKTKGFKSVMTITLTVVLIFKVLLPAILIGWNPLTTTIFIATVITLLTITAIAGFHKKSFAAILGTIIGVIIAGVISITAAKMIKLTGLSSEEAIMLMYLPQNISLNFQNLLFSGILLGALGAVMDVAMSIASSIQEIHNANNDLSAYELFQSGMEVGKDMMGTMSNTLILAYTGSFIPLMLLFMAYGTSYTKLINMDIVATEIVRSLSGSIGLILTIPITATIAVALAKNSLTKKVD
ncbi:MAG: YibE/F family protein [Clostridiales bacterium]|nr:YibE/F family protein [Clostridiales bacterium]